jgi:hypothetical protein
MKKKYSFKSKLFFQKRLMGLGILFSFEDKHCYAFDIIILWVAFYIELHIN